MIIVISSQKGGTGKTSTSISLVAGLARKGKRTLLVDIDSQANFSKVLLRDYLRIPKEQTIYATILERKALPVHPTGIDQLSQAALTKFANQPEVVSYTDCMVMAVADAYDTRSIFGFDQQFADAGYACLTPASRRLRNAA